MIPADHVFDPRRMRVARRNAGLSLWKLSARLARRGVMIRPEMLFRWEKGLYEPRLSAFIVIADILKRPPEYFFAAPPPKKRLHHHQEAPRASARG